MYRLEITNQTYMDNINVLFMSFFFMIHAKNRQIHIRSYKPAFFTFQPQSNAVLKQMKSLSYEGALEGF